MHAVVPIASIDALSDYDVILIVQDIHPFVEDRGWLDDFGEVLVVYWDPIHPEPAFGIDIIANVTQYASGLKIDFTLWPVSLFQRITAAPALPAELDAGYRVLLDKDGLTGTMQPPTGMAYVPKQPTSTTYLTLINDFFSEVPYVAKCLWRDELLPAKWCLDYDMKYTYLLPLLEWWVEIENGWSLPVGIWGKGLKRHLPPEVWAAFEQTCSGPRLADNCCFEPATCSIALLTGWCHFGYAILTSSIARRGVCEQIKRLEPPAHLSKK
jgi:aminoglycoside 6-adenylyltransferase